MWLQLSEGLRGHEETYCFVVDYFLHLQLINKNNIPNIGIYLHINNITRVQSLQCVIIVFSFNMQTGFNIALIQKKLTLQS